jgi:hypothetical protein
MGAMGTLGAPLGSITTGVGTGGALAVFAAGAGGIWLNRRQSAPPTGWGDWGRLSGFQPWTLWSEGPFAQVPAGSTSGLWAVFADGSLNTSADGHDWAAVAFPSASAPAAALVVSVGTDGTVWAVTAADTYYLDSEKNAWTWAGTHHFVQAPVGRATDLWSVDGQGQIWRSGNGGATWWEDTSYTGQAMQLSMCADGSVWVLDRNGTTSLVPAWQRIMRPTGMAGFARGVVTIASGRDQSGMRYIFIGARTMVSTTPTSSGVMPGRRRSSSALRRETRYSSPTSRTTAL